MRGSGIMLRRLNDALPGIVLGIIVYGAAVFLAGIWFVPDQLRFTTGLAIGIALADVYKRQPPDLHRLLSMLKLNLLL